MERADGLQALEKKGQARLEVDVVRSIQWCNECRVVDVGLSFLAQRRSGPDAGTTETIDRSRRAVVLLITTRSPAYGHMTDVIEISRSMKWRDTRIDGWWMRFGVRAREFGRMLLFGPPDGLQMMAQASRVILGKGKRQKNAGSEGGGSYWNEAMWKTTTTIITTVTTPLPRRLQEDSKSQRG